MQPRTKRLLWFAVLPATLIIGVVVVISVTVATSSNSSSSQNSGTTNNPSNDPSDTSNLPFSIDPALHRSFWGIAYTPFGGVPPLCGATLAHVTKDIKKLSQLTPRLRLYGSDCNVTSLVLNAMEDLNVDMSVFPAISLESSDESYVTQRRALTQALADYGQNRVLGIVVGNGRTLNTGSRNDTSTNTTTGVVERMADVRNDLVSLGYSDIPVGTSDSGEAITQGLVDGADFIFANIHPWFSANSTAQQAADLTQAVLNTNILPLVERSPRKTVVYQGEMGWPSKSSDADLGINAAGSPAAIPELQTVLDTWVCQANKNGTRYFWFSAFDEGWRAIYGGVEPHWGLFDLDRKLKDITIPDCPIS